MLIVEPHMFFRETLCSNTFSLCCNQGTRAWLHTFYCLCIKGDSSVSSQASRPCCSSSPRWWRTHRTGRCVTCCLPTRSVSPDEVLCKHLFSFWVVDAKAEVELCSSRPIADWEGHLVAPGVGGAPGQQPGPVQAVAHAGPSTRRWAFCSRSLRTAFVRLPDVQCIERYRAARVSVNGKLSFLLSLVHHRFVYTRDDVITFALKMRTVMFWSPCICVRVIRISKKKKKSIKRNRMKLLVVIRDRSGQNLLSSIVRSFISNWHATNA